MDNFRVRYFVPGGAGTVEETFQAASEYNVRRLVEARYPDVRVRVVDVTCEHVRPTAKPNQHNR